MPLLDRLPDTAVSWLDRYLGDMLRRTPPGSPLWLLGQRFNDLANLGSRNNGLGASLVAVEDPDGNFDAPYNVENCLRQAIEAAAGGGQPQQLRYDCWVDPTQDALPAARRWQTIADALVAMVALLPDGDPIRVNVSPGEHVWSGNGGDGRPITVSGGGEDPGGFNPYQLTIDYQNDLAPLTLVGLRVLNGGQINAGVDAPVTFADCVLGDQIAIFLNADEASEVAAVFFRCSGVHPYFIVTLDDGGSTANLRMLSCVFAGEGNLLTRSGGSPSGTIALLFDDTVVRCPTILGDGDTTIYAIDGACSLQMAGVRFEPHPKSCALTLFGGAVVTDGGVSLDIDICAVETVTDAGSENNAVILGLDLGGYPDTQDNQYAIRWTGRAIPIPLPDASIEGEYRLRPSDQFFDIDVTSATVTVFLDDPATCPGRTVEFSAIGTFALILNAADEGGTIDGAPSLSISGLADTYGTIQIRSTGNDWRALAPFSTGSGGVPTSRTISTTAPLQGGGDLSANRTLSVSNATEAAVGVVRLAPSGGTTAGQVVQATDARLSDTRTPTDNSVSTAKIQDGAVTAIKISDGVITDAKIAAANKDGLAAVASMRTLGTGAQQAAAGNDSRIVGAVQTTRTISTPSGSGLSGGGDLSADRTLQVVVDAVTIGIVTNTISLIQAALTAIGALTPAADRLPYYTSASAAALATFTAFGRSLVAAADAAAARTVLALGGSATLNVGTTAGTVAAGDDARITGAEQTANKNASNGYAGLTSGLLSPAQIPTPTRTALGGTYLWPQASGVFHACGPAYTVSLTVPSPTATRIHAAVWDRPGTYDQITANVVVGAASGSLRHYLYESDTNGAPGALLWSSGDISATVTGSRALAFSAGTWTSAGDAYKDGSNNFILRPGQKVWYGTQAENGAPLTIRSVPGASARLLGYATGAPAGTDAISIYYRDVAYASGLPDPFGTPTKGQQTTFPLTTLRGL